MVKTELSYNPYLLETGVKFNGNEPKINKSAVCVLTMRPLTSVKFEL